MSIVDYAQYEPVYEEMDGWKISTRGITRYEDLPVNAKNYLQRLGELVDARIDVVSTGPERESTIILNNPFVKQ